MKPLRIALGILTALCAVAVPSLFAQTESNRLPYIETILSFESDIIVDTTARVNVTERIKVAALGNHIKRGIYRKLPQGRDINGTTVYVRNKFLSVKRDGKEEPFHTTSEGDFDVVYIGDEDVLLDPGIYEYEITYTTDRQIGFFEDFDELYWNVTGTEWIFPIKRVRAVVHLPENAEIKQHACYTGVMGSTERNCEGKQVTQNVIEWTASNLWVQEGLTVAAGFNKGIVKLPNPPAYMKEPLFRNILFGITAVLLIVMFLLWRRYGVDHANPVAIPRFYPPDDLSPAGAGYLNLGFYTSQLATVTLINLAVKGYIRIRETTSKGFLGTDKSTYTLENRQKSYAHDLAPEEQFLYHRLFGSTHSIQLSGTYDDRFSSTILAFIEKVDERYKSLHKKGANRKYAWILFGVVTVIYWALLSLCQHHIYLPYKWLGSIIVYFIYIVLFVILASAPSVKTASWFWIISIAVTAAVGFIGYRFLHVSLDPYTYTVLFLILNTNFLIIFSYLIRQPSPEYLTKKAQLDGFSMYLKAAETNVIQFFNSPAMTPEIFERHLPYAIALGVDKIWGEKFEKYLYNQSTRYNSTWYDGGGYNQSFSLATFSSLSSTLSGYVSSGSSSSGGSGGGGSSGGGGGGGGGGGW
jgi:uncharacterized membrane protein